MSPGCSTTSRAIRDRMFRSVAHVCECVEILVNGTMVPAGNGFWARSIHPQLQYTSFVNDCRRTQLALSALHGPTRLRATSAGRNARNVTPGMT